MDFIACPFVVDHGSPGGVLGRDIGPVRLPFRAVVDPPADQINLRRSEFFSSPRRWHAAVIIGADPQKHLALATIAWNNGKTTRTKLGQGVFGPVQTQV